MKYVILILLTASISMAQPGQLGGGRGFDGKGIGRMEDKLDLSADQQKQVETFRSDMQKKQIDLTAKVRTLRVEIRDLYNKENPDQNAIESKMTEIGKLQNEIKLNHSDFWFAVNKILTAEQKKVWKERGHLEGRGLREGSHGYVGRRGGRGDGFGGGGRPYRYRDGSCLY